MARIQAKACCRNEAIHRRSQLIASNKHIDSTPAQNPTPASCITAPAPLNSLEQCIASVLKLDRLVTIIAQVGQMYFALRPCDFNFVRHPISAVSCERQTSHYSASSENKLHT